MSRSSLDTDSLAVVESRSKGDDLWFLLYFIMGTYFGPDIKGEGPPQSVLQRMARGLPLYTSEQLSGSYMKIMDMQQAYYYILRKADKSVLAKSPILRQFFRGNLQKEGSCFYPQFTDLFPLELHPQSRIKNRYKIVENIVFINNPELLYIKLDDMVRFKRLSGLDHLLLDAAALGFIIRDVGLGISLAGETLHNVAVHQVESDDWCLDVSSLRSSQKKRRKTDILKAELPLQVMLPVRTNVQFNSIPEAYSPMVAFPSVFNRTCEKSDPAIIFLPSRPSEREWWNLLAVTKSGFALTGIAAMGPVRPLLGHIDIEECSNSYLFRVSLPGVKRDEREFSCEVEINGKVLIKGFTTTGERIVKRNSHVFKMQTQNLCPPGMFSISFQLPGPIEPKHFTGNFGIDGMLEGLAMKGGNISIASP